LVAFLAHPVAADDRPIQCFGRGYTEEELRANPDQIVETIVLLIRDPVSASEEERSFCNLPKEQADLILWVVFADQGLAGQTNTDGILFEQTAKCRVADGGATTCGDEFWTGEILLQPKTDGTLNATTDRFSMPWIAECGGVINIATSNETTVFPLERQDNALCLRILEDAS